MKSMFTTTVIMLAMVLSIAALKPNKRKHDCNAGMFFMKKCNYCWCTVKAMKKDAWCTNFPCKKGDRGNRGLSHNRPNSPILKLEPTYTGLRNGSCTPGTTFKLDCNDCLCLHSGAALCSLVNCIKGVTKGRIYQGDTCRQGESWKEDCNKCYCPSSGLRLDALCTRKKCTKANKVRLFPSNLKELNALTSKYKKPSLFPLNLNQERQLTPEYNEPRLFLSDVNEEGQITPEYIEPSLFTSNLNKEGQLIPGYNEPSLFPSNLNQVGKLTSKYKAFENETHCTPKTKFYLACNPCICQSSGIKSGSPCDNMGCPPFTPYYADSAKCTPGTSYKQDCNYCRCGKSGVVADSGCTLMRCVGIHP